MKLLHLSFWLLALAEPAHAFADDHHHMDDMAGMDMGEAKDSAAHMQMQGFYGQYSMNRDSSGTAWQPDSTPMEGIHLMPGDWMIMLHGYDNVVYDHQGGRRGDSKTFDSGMLMGMATHPLGDGTIGFRAMLSPDPLMGKSGYPLLLQTGETANGVTPLIDRQHPHDLFMELATTYSHPITSDSSVFVYVGYPGEPALGPPAFMHRFSGMDNAIAPITHHWMDSTHVDFGVVTAGYVWKDWKLEGSLFNGREPDQYRWNFDPPRLNSQSVRLTYNPTANWSMQVSQGWITSPEQLEPNVDQRRTTASATYNLPFDKNNWQTTAAWGMDDNRPGHQLNAFLLESAVALDNKHTFFGRAERVKKDELFTEPDTGLPTDSPLAGRAFNVNAFSLGYIYDIQLIDHLKMGIGGMGTIDVLPSALDSTYGQHPASFLLFARVKLD